MADLNKILHVDDDEDILEIVKMVLELIGGFQIKQANCGSSALGIVEGFAPDLILADLQMPEMTGPEMLREIRRLPEYEEIPGILLTAKLVGSEAEALLTPADLGIIGKPFDPETLADEVRTLWNTRL